MGRVGPTAQPGGGEGARGAAVRMAFVGSSTHEMIPEDQLPGRHHYFLGDDPARWRSDVPLFTSVRYRGMHAGLDVCVREHDGHFEYDLLLAPNAELQQIEVAVDGIEGMHVDGDGSLVMTTVVGAVHMPAPMSWETGPSGEKRLIACHYEVRGTHRFGFVAPERQAGWALVVDPGLVWSTYIGGSNSEVVADLRVDAQGAVTFVGITNSTDFPTTPGAFDLGYNGGVFGDAFVTRLDASGSTLVYSTYLGSVGDDTAQAMALDAQGAVTVVGSAGSGNFPTTPGAFDTSYNGGTSDAFVVRLSPSGANLVYATLLGGASEDLAGSVVVDALGIATVGGSTGSSGFPTTSGAFDPTYNGTSAGSPFGDGFVLQLSPNGSSLVFSTFLGGTNVDSVNAVGVDAQGVVAVAGYTFGAGFPVTAGAFDTTHNGYYDAFVARLLPNGSGLVYSTFLGGINGEYVGGLCVDGLGAVTITGNTDSSNLPVTAGAFDTTYNGGTFGDAFVARMTPAGSALVFSTFLGGTDGDEARALAIDVQGAVTITGVTSSTDFPTTIGAYDTTLNGNDDVFVARLTGNGVSLVYSTYLGGLGVDSVWALALDARGAATIGGSTGGSFPPSFPVTPGAYSTTSTGFLTDDGFVSRLDMLPTGVVALGASSPGCNGPLPISVNSMPRVGNAAFGLTCGNAAPNSIGLIAFTDAALTTPVQLFGVDVWIDSTLLLITGGVGSDANGAAAVPLPIPSNPSVAGVRVFAQFLWLGPTGPAPCPALGVSTSHALDITVQP